jgi:hypothetical protein
MTSGYKHIAPPEQGPSHNKSDKAQPVLERRCLACSRLKVFPNV